MRLSATHVSRNFSEVLNGVRSGEPVEIVRNGEPVARLSAIAPPATVSAAAWRALMAGVPDADADFADDVRAARASLPVEAGAWPSS